MSHDARTWVWDHSRSKGTARLVLALIADRCLDRRCIAYASVPALMKRANASRTAVRNAIDKLILSGELKRLDDRKGPRGETYYKLPDAARFLAEQAAEGGGQSTAAGPESAPSPALAGGPEGGLGERIPPPEGSGFRPGGGTGSGPQNGSEPKVNGKSSSSAPLISAAEWQIDDATRAWLDQDGQRARLGEQGLRIADEKWRSYRAGWAPRTAAAWACDWRAWIAREHTPAPGRPHLRALPGGETLAATTTRMTRAEEHTAALLAALGEASVRWLHTSPSSPNRHRHQPALPGPPDRCHHRARQEPADRRDVRPPGGMARAQRRPRPHTRHLPTRLPGLATTPSHQPLPALRGRREPHKSPHPRQSLRRIPPPQRPEARPSSGRLPQAPSQRPHPPRRRPRRLQHGREGHVAIRRNPSSARPPARRGSPSPTFLVEDRRSLATMAAIDTASSQLRMRSTSN